MALINCPVAFFRIAEFVRDRLNYLYLKSILLPNGRLNSKRFGQNTSSLCRIVPDASLWSARLDDLSLEASRESKGNLAVYRAAFRRLLLQEIKHVAPEQRLKILQFAQSWFH